MKNYLLFIIVLAVSQVSISQETITFPNQSTVITTGIPFTLIAPDSRSAGMGDMGVATSVDGFSQQWNPAKYAFSEAKSGLGLSFTPYLTRLVNDISISYATYFNRLNEFSAISGSIKYFSLGDIVLTQDANDPGISVRPNEYAVDFAYSLKLTDQFSMAVGLRYFRSALRIGEVDPNANPASSFGADITGYYQSEEEAYNDFNGRWRAGFAIQNLGPKFTYDDGGEDVFQPTNLRLGGGFDFIFDQNSTLGITAEVSKYLVPTPPLLGFVDTDGDGEQGQDEPTIITEGEDNDVGFLTGVFQSFGDAPGGFSEELKEFTWALGAEYLYQESFALRAGYFNESDEKGARKFFTLGAGFKYTTINIDLSYLFSASRVQSPLENTLRFSLTFNFGDGTYQEY
ncbi:type IX secretion system outer membrane channel protein PorV [Winogradskyella immobilis]|uniref:Type IX secretion system outer membrane channel protein PorV n=1 Tax=Winogradskyella immobilis TaxID=2816852 RepID=A0ABS8ENG9_9FLAO|nr:type IX secretion system outer membrane channel protein PorV [Winogradskyella immobilis]MCC1484754.1 type IX secretion system outer membrane channel protein PorV [Winogradskyella immobilis]MCG0016846.1 type IX secretion system outer membrane channel protein PorV [Winogradskyella immobilis]